MEEKRTIQVSAERYAKLEREAKAMNLSVDAYLEFRESSLDRRHDVPFRNAARYLFKNYPETLRKLAQ